MSSRKRQLWCGVWSVLALLGLCSPAAAQIVVPRIEPAADPTCAAIEAQLTDWGIVQDPGYFGEAQRQGLDPASDYALTRLIPPLGARLALVPVFADASSVTIDFRDGGSGASLGVVRIPMMGDQLDAAALRGEVASRIGTPPSAAGAEDVQGSTAQDSTPAPSPGPEAHEEFPALQVRVSGGAGIGGRTLLWPSAGQTWSVDTGMFATVDLASSFHIAVSSTVALGLDFSYQTSVAAEIQETHISGQMESLGIRANHLAAVFAIAVGGSGVRVTPAFGYATRGLRPGVHHLLTPSYSLAGPVGRVAVRIPFSETFSLHLVPEAQYLLVGEGLKEVGVASSGYALGGEVAFELAVSSQVSLELSGRFARAWMDTASGTAATDTERFATARVVWQP